jgi:predicted nuclease with TOPRIM domain
MHVLKGSWKPTWSRGEMNAMAPLLEAFEETLAEKEELISNYKREMQLFTNRVNEIVAENESLHAQLVEANKKVGKYGGCNLEFEMEPL